MSYVDRNLIPGEKVFYKTGLHWSVLIGPFLGALVSLAGAVLFAIYGYKERDSAGDSGLGNFCLAVAGFLAIIAVISFISGTVKRDAVEMAVTNKRVVVKTGILSRRTLELLLSQIESILVEESVMGRTLGFGAVIIRGTGSTPERFPNIAHPLEFRKQVQEHIEIYQQQARTPAAPPPPLG